MDVRTNLVQKGAQTSSPKTGEGGHDKLSTMEASQGWQGESGVDKQLMAQRRIV